MSNRRHSRKGLRPLARQVPKRDASVILLSLPGCERVPPLILRLITRWRGLRSAALLSDGPPVRHEDEQLPVSSTGQALGMPLNPPAELGLHCQRLFHERPAQRQQPLFQRQLSSGRRASPGRRPFPAFGVKPVALPMPTGPARRLPGTRPSARECPAAEPAPDPDRGWAQHLCLSPG